MYADEFLVYACILLKEARSILSSLFFKNCKIPVIETSKSGPKTTKVNRISYWQHSFFSEYLRKNDGNAYLYPETNQKPTCSFIYSGEALFKKMVWSPRLQEWVITSHRGTLIRRDGILQVGVIAGWRLHRVASTQGDVYARVTFHRERVQSGDEFGWAKFARRDVKFAEVTFIKTRCFKF